VYLMVIILICAGLVVGSLGLVKSIRLGGPGRRIMMIIRICGMDSIITRFMGTIRAIIITRISRVEGAIKAAMMNTRSRQN
jgi:hypothetical protein